MKNSKEYSQKIERLYRSLKRKFKKPTPPQYEDPVDALVFATVAEHLTERQAEQAIKRFRKNFVDWNDLRVSLREEIVEILGGDTKANQEIANTLIKILKEIFTEHNMVSLEYLYKFGKRKAREELENIEGMTSFITDYIMLTAIGAHAIPLTSKMLEHLRSKEMVYPEADDQDINGFLCRQISSDDAYQFYRLLRWDSESTRPSKKRKTKKKKKPKKKTKKKKKKKTKKSKKKG